MLDVKGGETDRTAFFSIEVTFFLLLNWSEALSKLWAETAGALRDLVHMLTSDTTYWRSQCSTLPNASLGHESLEICAKNIQKSEQRQVCTASDAQLIVVYGE